MKKIFRETNKVKDTEKYRRHEKNRVERIEDTGLTKRAIPYRSGEEDVLDLKEDGRISNETRPGPGGLMLKSTGGRNEEIGTQERQGKKL
jgi:hypothetical protein